jgi:hypothetical protein
MSMKKGYVVQFLQREIFGERLDPGQIYCLQHITGLNRDTARYQGTCRKCLLLTFAGRLFENLKQIVSLSDCLFQAVLIGTINVH